ncbi:MAG TPA: hydroxymethylbilane synthase [Acidobacteriota bacterium]|nr:hydroxymethylbilane synthase [Acidobacteriota bacterium]
MLTIGSRGSTLALAQTTWIKNQIQRRFSDVQVTIKVIRTSADKDATSSIRAGSGIGVFVKEIEEALLAHEIDLAVHSMKDVPTRIPDQLEIAAIPEREDPRDALIIRGSAENLEGLPSGAAVGTGSVRRQAQILAWRKDIRVADIRGNVDTRLQKLANGAYDAIVLACAGLIRLGLDGRITARLDLARMLPAPGQGALALETRKGDHAVHSVIDFLNHRPTAVTVRAERAFLRRLGGGCNVPVAVHAAYRDGTILIDGLISAPDGSRIIRDSTTADDHTAEEAAVVLADKILSHGGKFLLEDGVRS